MRLLPIGIVGVGIIALWIIAQFPWDEEIELGMEKPSSGFKPYR